MIAGTKIIKNSDKLPIHSYNSRLKSTDDIYQIGLGSHDGFYVFIRHRGFFGIASNKGDIFGFEGFFDIGVW